MSAEQMPLFDLAAGRRLRDEGMANAELGADPDWCMAASRALAELAATGRPFTTDDVWQRVGPVPGGDPRALGPIVLRASKAGTIERVGFRHSVRTACHARTVAVWQGRDR